MKKKKSKNPLIKRIPRELLGDWRKYLVVSLFLILVIGFVSGMYVANESMVKSAKESKTEYKLEDGHFELKKKADAALLSSIEKGEKADIKEYFIEKSKKELDEKFEDEFKPKFTAEFDVQFGESFDETFAARIKNELEEQGLDEKTISEVFPSALEEAKKTDEYQMLYQTAYEEAYQDAYDEAYKAAYDEAWDDILVEVDEEYAEAEETYDLDNTDFKAVPVKVHENFYRNEDEDNNNDGISDGTVRVYKKTDTVNLACIMEGRLPEKENEIAVDRMHADNVSIKVGDSITVGAEKYCVVGLIAYVNYATLHEKNTDFMFDALKFNVAMVTEDGFERLTGAIHYAYAWQYLTGAEDELQEKNLSDDFLPALLTQTITSENELEDYLPRYANQAVNFAADDMGSDMAMGGVLLNLLIVIIAFIFAVTISNTITKESKTIGTLRASGYTRGEIIRHYIAMPVIVTLIAATIGNILGYTVFKNVVVSMYYNSYSLPAYKTIWNPDAFYKTTLTPIALMFLVNLLVIIIKMKHTPLEFLRGDLKKTKRKKAMRLPRWRFFMRFRLRIIFQNMPNYLILFLGIFFVMVMLAMAVGMPNTLKYYQENASNMMFAKYQYILKACENEDGSAVVTENEMAEKFCMKSLQRKSGTFDEEISVYGIADDSRYVDIDNLKSLQEGEVYLSDSFRDKYDISMGDTIILDEKYENRKYSFQVAGFYDKSLSLSIFMPIGQFQTVFDMEGEFSGYLTDTEIVDLEEDNIATIITENDITKMADQLNHSMGAYMQYFQVLCILLSAVMIYLLTKIIIEKNETAISMTKILGYENKEIAGLYLLSTTIMLILADVASVALGTIVMKKVWKSMMSEFSGWFTFVVGTAGYIKMFLFVLIGYLIVLYFDFVRIKKIPMDEALKNVE